MQFLLETHVGQLVMLASALVAGWYSCRQLILVARASHWPTVEGEVISADLIQRGSGASGLVERVKYRYSVAGEIYVSDRLRFGPQLQRSRILPETGYPRIAGIVAQRYPVGGSVTVHYNPQRPRDSVLYAQPNRTVVGLLAVAVTFGFLGLRALFWGR